MGNILSITCFGKKEAPICNGETCLITRNQSPSPTSSFYHACREGDSDQVKQLLASTSLDEINKIEPNGSTALHVACYYGHYDIVKILLDAGASRSIRNRRYQLTPFEEAHTEQIRRLFYRVNSTNKITSDVDNDRFTGLSGHTEWVVESKQAADWKINLYKCLKLEQPFDEVIAFLNEHYLANHVARVCQSQHDKQVIQWFFHQAVLQQNAQYIVKAYTSVTQFYSIVNTHLAQFLLRFFRWNYNARHANTLEKSVGYLASIFIYHPDLRSLSYIGITYRGMVLSRHDLSIYNVGKRLLNKSFLSTSIDRHVAKVFAGAGDSKCMRRNLNNDPIQYMTLCTYKITNPDTALFIGTISEVPLEQEVLIMPLCAFQIKAIKKNLDNDSNIDVEIELEECVSSCFDDVNQSTEFVPKNSQSRILC
ncbi:unnamed protein product [Rotaria sp. Silwood2]|nr:unnamed protein product [Rotaria sp. Silwood2]CAF3025492.1 unnamed protein product [Rotaria sp. Silwood2]CAF3268114.1 unnamed protein product [Rotaria sp. Silwood2]CAF3366915.1 unnamed protein product [Rotaria sp. Silwood2]CAF4068965.1 unnamed protein product [Rotaria sp. Silwood2]